MALETRAWNLGAVALGVGACGPLIALPADTDGDTQGDDDPSQDTTDTTPTPTVTTTPGGCDPPCPAGWECRDGFCYYACYGAGCYPGESGYYDCSTHDDCNGQQYCNYYSCTFLPYVYECPGAIAYSTEIIPAIGGAVSLAFADTNGDGFEDLAVYDVGSSGWVVRGPDGELVSIELGGAGGEVVATDLDGVPPTELSFSIPDAATLVTMRVVGEPQPVAVTEWFAQTLVAGDFDDDGMEDVAGQIGSTISALFSDGMQFSTGSELDWTVSSTLAVGRLGVSPGEDIAFADGVMLIAEMWPGGGGISQLGELYALPNRTPVVGDFDGNGMDDLFVIAERGTTTSFGAIWTQITAGELERQSYFGLPNVYPGHGFPFAGAAGDIDADGYDDLVIVGTGSVVVMFSGLACWQSFPTEGLARVVAVGNFDGEGGDDIAWSDGSAYLGLIRPG